MQGDSGMPQHTRRKMGNYAPKAPQKPLLQENLLTQKLSDQPHAQFIKENKQTHKEKDSEVWWERRVSLLPPAYVFIQGKLPPTPN